MKSYEEMHSTYPRMMVKDGPNANQIIEDLRSKGYIIRKVRQSDIVDGMLSSFLRNPRRNATSTLQGLIMKYLLFTTIILSSIFVCNVEAARHNVTG